MKATWRLFVAWWKEHRRKAAWNEKRQIHRMVVNLDCDGRWLGHNRIAAALITRYQGMASDTWEKHALEDISAFRTRMGLDPNRQPKPLLTPEMIREVEVYLPRSIALPEERWFWVAQYLNRSIENPNEVCPCCKVTRSGDVTTS